MHLARSPEMIHLLAAAGADSNLKARGGVTAMRQAYRRGDPAAIEALIECGANMNDYDAHGMRHLRGVAQFISPKIAGGTRLLDMMVRAGADIHAVCHKNMSVLASASAAGHYEYVEYLVAAGAEVNIRDWVGDTPLLEAVHAKCEHSVRILLDNGADYRCVRKTGDNILHQLAMFAEPRMMRMFEELRMTGVDTGLTNDQGKTPRDLLRRRKDFNEELSEAFEMVIASIDADVTSEEGEDDDDIGSDMGDAAGEDEFFDAAESHD
jgi:ankyrin repeat protein